MKLVKRFAALMLALLMIASLVGCSGFNGTYRMSAATVMGNEYDGGRLASIGLDPAKNYITFGKNNQVKVNMLGVNSDGVYEKDGDSVTISYGDESITGSISGNTVTFVVGGNTYVLKKA